MPLEAIRAMIWWKCPNWNPDDFWEWPADAVFHSLAYIAAQQELSNLNG